VLRPEVVTVVKVSVCPVKYLEWKLQNVLRTIFCTFSGTIGFLRNVEPEVEDKAANIYTGISLGAFAASELDKVFSGYQPR